MNALVPIPEEAAVSGPALAAGTFLEDRGGVRASGAGQAVPNELIWTSPAYSILWPRTFKRTDGNALFPVLVW